MEQYFKFVLVDTQGNSYDTPDIQVIIGEPKLYIETQLRLLVKDIAANGGMYIDTQGYSSAYRVASITPKFVNSKGGVIYNE